MAKATGVHRSEKNCGRQRIRARRWRFGLVGLHAASGPPAGRTQARSRSLSSKLQREDQLGGRLSRDKPRERVPVRSSRSPRQAIKGVILSDHLKGLDWRQRKAQKAGRIPVSLLTQVRDRIAALLGFS